MTRLICDIGSTHGNDMDRICEIINLCCETDAVLKFQLFKNMAPNIELNRRIFQQACMEGEAAGIEVFASVFDPEAIELLDKRGCVSIKFAYSQRNRVPWPRVLKSFQRIYVSYGWMDVIPEEPSLIPLYVIPNEYPVVHQIDFTGVFPRFKGFSSHCIGIEQCKRAVEAGAEVLEVHVKPSDPPACPDAMFALSKEEVRDLAAWCKRFDGQKIQVHTGETGPEGAVRGPGVREDPRD